PFRFPQELDDEKVLFMTDILPTGYQAVVNAGVRPGSSLAIFGAGPVGLMSAACARLLGAEEIYMVDDDEHRLELAARTYGVIPINFNQYDDPAHAIIEQTPGYRGVDAAIDAGGFEAKGSTTETVLKNLKLEGSIGKALRQCIAVVRRGGTVSVPGVRSEEHTSELQSRENLVCRLLLEKKKNKRESTYVRDAYVLHT